MSKTFTFVLLLVIGCGQITPQPAPSQTYWPPKYRIELFVGRHISTLDSTTGFKVIFTDYNEPPSFNQYLVVWPYKDPELDRYLSWWITTQNDTIRTVHLKWY